MAFYHPKQRLSSGNFCFGIICIQKVHIFVFFIYIQDKQQKLQVLHDPPLSFAYPLNAVWQTGKTDFRTAVLHTAYFPEEARIKIGTGKRSRNPEKKKRTRSLKKRKRSRNFEKEKENKIKEVFITQIRYEHL